MSGRALPVADQIIEQWHSEDELFLSALRVEAGMSIPRQPAEIFEGSGQSVINGEADVIEKEGANVTAGFGGGFRCSRFMP